MFRKKLISSMGVALGVALLSNIAPAAEMQDPTVCYDGSTVPFGGSNTNAAVSVPLTSPLSDNVLDVDVWIKVPSEYAGDLSVSLSHGGTTRELIKRLINGAGNCNSDGQNGFSGTLLDDDASNPIQTISTPDCEAGATGTYYSKDKSLNDFNDVPADGTWTLTVVDEFRDAGTSHVFQNWCLKLTAGAEIAGDFNSDFKVDFLDVNEFQRAYIYQDTSSKANMNGDNVIDIVDLNLFQAAWFAFYN